MCFCVGVFGVVIGDREEKEWLLLSDCVCLIQPGLMCDRMRSNLMYAAQLGGKWWLTYILTVCLTRTARINV